MHVSSNKLAVLGCKEPLRFLGVNVPDLWPSMLKESPDVIISATCCYKMVYHVLSTFWVPNMDALRCTKDDRKWMVIVSAVFVLQMHDFQRAEF